MLDAMKHDGIGLLLQLENRLPNTPYLGVTLSIDLKYLIFS